MSLPAYSGFMGTCRKCGTRGPQTEYNDSSEDLVITSDGGVAQIPHMVRMCSNCGYTWHEATIDPNDYVEEN